MVHLSIPLELIMRRRIGCDDRKKLSPHDKSGQPRSAPIGQKIFSFEEHSERQILLDIENSLGDTLTD